MADRSQLVGSPFRRGDVQLPSELDGVESLVASWGGRGRGADGMTAHIRVWLWQEPFPLVEEGPG